MPSLQETFERLTTLEMFESGRPASPEEIQQIEAELRVALPEQYAEFLKRFGYAGSFGWEVFGTRPIDPATERPSTVTSDCIKATKEEKNPENPLGTSSLPPAHVVISQDGGGGNVVLFGVGAPHEGEVHYYNLEDQTEPIQVWQTFQDYLERRIEEAISS
jgi:hypothetical protein